MFGAFDAFVIQDVTVLHAVCSQPDRVLDRFGVGRMGHHLELAQVTDLEGRLQLVLQQEGVPVEVPGGPQDAARQVQLDVVDAILDLLADRLDEASGPSHSSACPEVRKCPPVVVRKWPEANRRGPRTGPSRKLASRRHPYSGARRRSAVR